VKEPGFKSHLHIVTLGISLNFSELPFSSSNMEMIIPLQMVGEDLKHYIQSIGTSNW